VEAFPLTASGKVQKNVLREHLASAPPITPTKALVSNIGYEGGRTT
jgi:hypothetical protein